MRQSPAWLAAWCLAISACNTNSVRLEIERDTLVLYGNRLTPLPVKAFDRSGAQTYVVPTVRRADGVAINGGWVSCLRPGRTRVSLSAKGTVGSIVVECRSLRELHPQSDIDLELRDEPRALAAAGILESGEVVSLEPLAVAIHDSTIVSVNGNRVTPLAVGYTNLKIDYGGVVASTRISVRNTIVSGPLELKAGESRQWDLTPGRYDILVIVSSPLDLASLRMETDGAQCARNSSNEDLIHCVVYERGSVTMSNTSAAPKARTSRAIVNIRQTS